MFGHYFLNLSASLNSEAEFYGPVRNVLSMSHALGDEICGRSMGTDVTAGTGKLGLLPVL